jgi:predicted SAM-dependent methyltransferase
MFFPEKITLIKQKDKVLEVGPGGNPYDRSDVFLELRQKDDDAYYQRGLTDHLITDKPLFYYENNSKFPFEDNQFDYVICSHVIEHVENIPFFLNELFRVAQKGYLEYPTIYYEYLYNFSVHKNFIKFNDNCLYYLKKENTSINEFLPVQNFYYDTLKNGYEELNREFKHIMFEGFEWKRQFKFKNTFSIDDLVFKGYNIINTNYRERDSPLKLKILKSIKKFRGLYK